MTRKLCIYLYASRYPGEIELAKHASQFFTVGTRFRFVMTSLFRVGG